MSREEKEDPVMAAVWRAPKLAPEDAERMRRFMDHTETPADRARELADLRATTDASTRRDRLDAACKALEKCGLLQYVEPLHMAAPTFSAALVRAREAVQALRHRLRDGSDEPRYAATGAALTALGALWAAS